MEKFDTLLLAVIAVAQLIGAVFAWYTNRAAKATKAVAERTELNTNSMREQLVQRTGEAEYGRGREEQRAETKIEAKADALIASEEKPLPVEDTAAASIALRTAEATERSAEAQQRTAEATEKKV